MNNRLVTCFRGLVLLVFSFSLVAAQGGFTPRDVNEAQAWRIYNQYLTSTKKIDQLKAEIKMKRGDINTTSKSSIGAAGADPKDVEQLTKLRENLKIEETRLETAMRVWDEKFFRRYGDLAESAVQIYDPVTKQNMDKIRYRIIYNRFDPTKQEDPSAADGKKGGRWTLADVTRNVQKDKSYTPADWSGGENSATGTKSYQTINTTGTLQIVAAFNWQGIPKTAGQNEKVNLKINLNQSVNTETGYGSWIKVYYGEPGGVESDGPSAELGWRDAGKSVSAQSTFVFPSGSTNQFRIRVYCKIAGDVYEVIYLYKLDSGSKSIPTSAPAVANWKGDWQSTWGNLSLEQNGDVVTGNYEHDGGRISGKVIGNKIIGTWSEGPTYAGPNDAGEFEFTLSPNGKSFTGRWKYGTNGAWQAKPWTGTR